MRRSTGTALRPKKRSYSRRKTVRVKAHCRKRGKHVASWLKKSDMPF